MPSCLARDALPETAETRAQLQRGGTRRRVAGGDRDVEGWQGMLMQAEGFSRESFETIARHGTAADARRNRQSESRMRLTIVEHGYAEKFVREALAALLAGAKLGCAVQTLARLEFESADR